MTTNIVCVGVGKEDGVVIIDVSIGWEDVIRDVVRIIVVEKDVIKLLFCIFVILLVVSVCIWAEVVKSILTDDVVEVIDVEIDEPRLVVLVNKISQILVLNNINIGSYLYLYFYY